VADVRALPLKGYWESRALRIDVLWASPPCQDFSKHGLRCFYPNPPEPDLSIANAVGALINRLQPRFWVIENVWAARPWFTKLFGQVRAKPPGHALWSNLAFLLPNIEPHKSSSVQLKSRGIGAIPGKPGDWRKTYRGLRERHATGIRPVKATPGRWMGSHHDMTPAEAAVIPYPIGEAICAAVERRDSNQ